MLALQLIERLLHATDLCKHLGLSDVLAPTVALLAQSAVLEGVVRIIRRSLTQQEIANRVGETRKMINHVIGDLIKDGYLARDEKRRLVVAKAMPCRW